MGKIMELLSGKRSVADIQNNVNWIDNQLKNLEQTKFLLDQQIKQLQGQKEKLFEKLKSK